MKKGEVVERKEGEEMKEEENKKEEMWVFVADVKRCSFSVTTSYNCWRQMWY